MARMKKRLCILARNCDAGHRVMMRGREGGREPGASRRVMRVLRSSSNKQLAVYMHLPASGTMARHAALTPKVGVNQPTVEN